MVSRNEATPFKLEHGQHFCGGFAVIFALVLIFSARGELSAAFYPVIKLENSVFPVGMFALLCVFPFILEVKESIKWKYCLTKCSFQI